MKYNEENDRGAKTMHVNETDQIAYVVLPIPRVEYNWKISVEHDDFGIFNAFTCRTREMLQGCLIIRLL